MVVAELLSLTEHFQFARHCALCPSAHSPLTVALCSRCCHRLHITDEEQWDSEELVSIQGHSSGRWELGSPCRLVLVTATWPLVSVTEQLCQSRPFGNICSNRGLEFLLIEAQRGDRSFWRSHSQSVQGLEPRALDTQSPNSLTIYFLCVGSSTSAHCSHWPVTAHLSFCQAPPLSDSLTWRILPIHLHLVEFRASSDSAITRENFFTPGNVAFWTEHNITQLCPNLISSIYKFIVWPWVRYFASLSVSSFIKWRH